MFRRYNTDGLQFQGAVQKVLDRSKIFGESVRIDGKIEFIDRGLNHWNYRFWVKAKSPPKADSPRGGILRIPRDDSLEESFEDEIKKLRREAGTLEALEKFSLPFRVPRFVGFTGKKEGGETGMIETMVPMVSLDFYGKSPEHGIFSMTTIAQAAATIHALPIGSFSHLQGYTDSREHVLSQLREIPVEFFDQDSDARTVRDWIIEHLPKGRPAVVLHGDLLPQNVLWDSLTNFVGVVDWEFAEIGDPAYDLAIVTRGNSQLFGCPNGLNKLLEQYLESGGMAITKADVINHELLMILNWLWQAIRREQAGELGGHGPEQYRNKLHAVLRRA